MSKSKKINVDQKPGNFKNPDLNKCKINVLHTFLALE